MNGLSLASRPRLALLVLAVLAVGFGAARFVALGDSGSGRPMHVDEASNALIVGAMLEGGGYRYDPQDRHGPLLYDVLYPVLRLAGFSGTASLEAGVLRAASACASLAWLGFLYPLRRRLKTEGMIVAGFLLTAAAPLAYYGRYFIHEPLFVLVMMATLLAFVHAVERKGSYLWTGIGLGALAATKETVVLVVGAGAASWWLLSWIERRQGGMLPPLRWRSVMGAAAVAGVVAALAYTSGRLAPHEWAEGARGYLRFLHRAGGEGHEKPAWAYLAWLLKPGRFGLLWTGIFFLGLGTFGGVAALRDRAAGTALRFLALFAPLLFAIYSLIPYKTPWLALDFLVPGAFVAGYGACRLRHAFPQGRLVCGFVFLVAGVAMAGETVRLVYVAPADDRNPLAYSPTVPDVRNLLRAVEAVAAREVAGHALSIAVVGKPEGYWPLPWTLRRFSRVGYWEGAPAFPGDAAVVISSPEAEPDVAARLGPGWTALPYGLRPDVLLILHSK